jgi:putative transposase
VRTYLPKRLDPKPGKRATSQGWSTFVRKHAQAIVTSSFCVAVTATFRILYVFAAIEHVGRRMLHVNVTAYPTADRTLQQHCPQANALWERLLGTLRRECLDFIIPLAENHLRRLRREWVLCYKG